MPRYVDDEFVRVRRKGSPARLEAPKHRDAYAPHPPLEPRARRNSYQPRNQLTVYDNNLHLQRGRSASLTSGSRRRRHRRYVYDDASSSSSSTSSSRSTSTSTSRSPHRSRRNNRKPCGPHCPDQPHRTCPSPPADADADPKAQRNRTLLTAALATITTAAAANNIYQSAKAHGARKKQVREGEMCSAEEKRLRQRGRLLDVVSLGVAAVGVNNARMGWKRWEASRGSKQGE